MDSTQGFMEGFSFADFFNGTAGRFVAAAVVLVLLMALAGYFYKKSFSVRQMSYAAVLMALAVALSFIKFGLPQGGSVTLCSMLAVSLIGYWFGPSAGIIGGVSYGLLQLAIDPFVVHPLQLILDYPLAFGMLGVSGFFRKRENGLFTGFVVGALLRGCCSILSGVVFFSEYAGEMNAVVYSIGYNMSYISIEIVITFLIVSTAAFKNMIRQVKVV